MPTVTERIEALEKKVAELEGQLQARRDPESNIKVIAETVHQCLEKEFSVTVDGIQKG